MNGKPKIPLSAGEATKSAKPTQEVPINAQLFDLRQKLQRIEAFLNSRYNF